MIHFNSYQNFVQYNVNENLQDFPYLHKERKYIPLFTTMKQRGASSDDLMELYNLIILSRNTLSTENIDLTKLDSYDQVIDALQNIKLIEKTNKYLKLIPSPLRELIKAAKNQFSDLLVSYDDYEDYKNNFLKKVSSYKDADTFFNALKLHINSSNKSDFSNLLKKYSAYSSVKVIHTSNPILIVQVLDYETMKQVGSAQWCIATSVYSWKSYVTNELANQYIFHDLSLDSSDAKSMIGITSSLSGRIVAHFKDDRDAKDYVKSQSWFKYCAAPTMAEILSKPVKELFQMVKEDKIKITDFSKDRILELIKELPEFISVLDIKDYFTDKELFDLMDNIHDLSKYVSGQLKLDYIKYQKDINDPKRRQMEQENDMYIFLASYEYKEHEVDGEQLFKKVLSIERLVKIDPYDIKDNSILSMMQLRARYQGQDTKLYCIWLPKDIDQDMINNVNSSKYAYFLKLIDQKKEKI